LGALFRAGVVSLAAMVVILCGCGGGGGAGQQEFTEQDAAAIQATSENISTTVGGSFDPDDPQGSLGQIANTVRTMPRVASVDVTDRMMTVQYQGQLTEIWTVESEYRPPVGVQDAVVATAHVPVELQEVVGRRQAIVMHTGVWWEAEFWLVNYALDQMCTSLRQCGFADPVKLTGDGASVDVFKGLHAYGVVVIITHGNADNDHCYMRTGDIVSEAERLQYYDDWKACRLKPGTSILPDSVGTTRWVVTEKFFDKYYTERGHTFDHALFYNGQCKGFANNAMYQALDRAGVGCYLGWTQTQNVSPWSAAALLAEMTDGDTVAQAYNNLPANRRRDGSAILKYETGGTLQIVDPSHVTPETLWATGYYTGHVADCELYNGSSQVVRVVIAPGTCLDNPEADEQDIVVIRELDMSVSPQQWMSVPLYGCCINLDKSPPSAYQVLHIAQNQRPDLLSLGGAIARENASDSVAQDAVWVLTDDSPPDSGNYSAVWNLFLAAGLSPYDYDGFWYTYSSSVSSRKRKASSTLGREFGNALYPLH